MPSKQQQIAIATRRLSQAVDASCRASYLVLHGQDARAEFELAERLQREADEERHKVEQCAPEFEH